MRAHHHDYAIEPLETRRMLAVFSGTSGNDSIFIARSVDGTLTHVVINGTGNVTSDLSITVNGLGGNDSIDVQSTRSGSSVTVSGGDGNDLLQNTVSDLDAVFPGDFTFVGGAGTDSLAADNGSDATAGGMFLIQADSIFRASPSPKFLIRYAQIESLTYADNDNANTIEFINLQGPTHDIANVTIRGHGGNDTIRNFRFSDAGHWPTSFGTSGVTVDAGPGTDLIALSNAADLGSTYTMNATSIAVNSVFDDGGPLSYFNCESIDFRCSLSRDIIFLEAKPAATTLNFRADDGDDEFVVGDGDLDSNGWQLATLVGGNGADSIIFDDELDTQADGSTSSYTLNTQSLLKGTQLASYNGFESQTLKSANGVVSGQLNVVPVTTINGTESSMQTTTIAGGAARNTSVTLGNGSFANLFGTFNVFLDGGFLDRLTINDSIAGGLVNAYEVNTSQVQRIHTDLNLNQTIRFINYSGVSQLTLNTSDVFDTIQARGTPSGMTLIINANAGNDTFNLGDGNIDANLLGPVTYNGGAGTNSVTVGNGGDTLPESQVLNGLAFTDGFTHTFSSISTLTVSEGPGGVNLSLNSVSVPTTVNGGSGDDNFIVGGGDIDANIPVSSSAAPALVVNGAGGIDSIRFDDLNGPNVDSYIIQRTGGIEQLDKTDAGIHRWMSWGTMETVTLDASNAPTLTSAFSGIVVSDIITQLWINGNAGNDWVQIFDAQQPITVNTGLGGMDRMDVNFDFDAQPMTVIIDQSDDIEALNVHAPAVLRVTDDAVLVKTRLASSPANPNINGVLDLFGGAFLSRAGGPTLTQFRNQILTGRNGGAWNGAGAGGAITSSLASLTPAADSVGFGLGSAIAPTTIGPFSIAAGDTLLRYTLDGDADLNQIVNLDDFNRLAGNFGQSNRIWSDGDSTYDNLVNLDDFNALAGNFGLSLGTRIGEPASAGGKLNHSIRNLLEELT